MLLVLKSKKASGPRVQKLLGLLGDQLSSRGVAFSVSSFEDIEVFIEKGNVDLFIEKKPLENWNTIYPRKVWRYGGLAFMLAHLAKKKGVYFIDRFHEQIKDSSDVAKIVQMFRLALAGASIPKTYFAGSYSEEHLKSAEEYLGFPIVVKECNTSQGAGVFLAKDLSSLQEVIGRLSEKNERSAIFLQEFIPNTFEYRLLVTGDKVAVAEKKIRSEKEEFRNNVHLGAREEFMDVDAVKEEIRREALLASAITDIQVAGVDIVVKENGEPVIFEVNACPALTLDPGISQEIERLADYLALCEKK